MQQLLTFDNGLQLVQAGNGIMTRGNTYANTLTGLLAASSFEDAVPRRQSAGGAVADRGNVMAVRNQLGLTRQIFFCLLDGFDTHCHSSKPRRRCCSS